MIDGRGIEYASGAVAIEQIRIAIDLLSQAQHTLATIAGGGHAAQSLLDAAQSGRISHERAKIALRQLGRAL